jgi:hypothetical protein
MESKELADVVDECGLMDAVDVDPHDRLARRLRTAPRWGVLQVDQLAFRDEVLGVFEDPNAGSIHVSLAHMDESTGCKPGGEALPRLNLLARRRGATNLGRGLASCGRGHSRTRAKRAVSSVHDPQHATAAGSPDENASQGALGKPRIGERIDAHGVLESPQVRRMRALGPYVALAQARADNHDDRRVGPAGGPLSLARPACHASPMRRVWSLASSLAVAATLGCLRDPPAPSSTGEAQATPTTSSPTATASAVVTGTTGQGTAPLESRPPHPTMAHASWGEQVATRLVAEAASTTTAGTPVVTADGLLAVSKEELLSLAPGSERRGLRAALRAWQVASDDSIRGTALALASLALVLDPTVEGYRERLTDAFGLAAFAGTQDPGDGVAQSARATVAAAAGAGRQARALVDLVASTPKLNDETRAWLALARYTLNDRSDAFFDDVTAGLAARPMSTRLKDVLSGRLLEIGLFQDALRLVESEPEPALALVAGRAHVLSGRLTRAISLLEPLTVSLAGIDEPRRSEAFAWLGIARALDPTAAAAATAPLLGVLSLRAGWAKEAALVGALTDVTAGRLDGARQTLLAAFRLPPSTTLIERWFTGTLLDVCGATGDVACVNRVEPLFREWEADPARILRARGNALSSAARTGGRASEEARGPNAAEGSDDRSDGGTLEAAAAPAAETSTATMDWLGESARLAVGTRAQQEALLVVRRALAVGCPRRARLALTEVLKDPTMRVARALAISFAESPLAKAQTAAQALRGEGPPLALDDLLGVVDALGGAPLTDTDSLLLDLAKDPRPGVQRAVERARRDLSDPQARRQRRAEQTRERPVGSRGFAGFGVDEDGGTLPAAPELGGDDERVGDGHDNTVPQTRAPSGEYRP